MDYIEIDLKRMFGLVLNHLVDSIWKADRFSLCARLGWKMGSSTHIIMAGNFTCVAEIYPSHRHFGN